MSLLPSNSSLSTGSSVSQTPSPSTTLSASKAPSGSALLAILSLTSTSGSLQPSSSGFASATSIRTSSNISTSTKQHPVSSTSTELTATSLPVATRPSGVEMPTGAIVGIVIGALIFALLLFRRRQFAKRQELEGTDAHSHPLGDDRRYSTTTMQERERGGGTAQYAIPLAHNNPLLSPSIAMDTFITSPRVANPPTRIPLYDNPVPVLPALPPVAAQRQQQSTTPLADMSLTETRPAAGRLSPHPSKKGRGGGSRSKKKKLVTMPYRPYSMLTDSERTSTRALIRIESFSSREDHRGRSGTEHEHDVENGQGGLSVGGHDVGSPTPFHSFDFETTEEDQQFHHPPVAYHRRVEFAEVQPPSRAILRNRNQTQADQHSESGHGHIPYLPMQRSTAALPSNSLAVLPIPDQPLRSISK